MALYTYSAIVNYPDDEQETPIFTDLYPEQVARMVSNLLYAEGDCLTSALITIVKQKED